MEKNYLDNRNVWWWKKPLEKEGIEIGIEDAIVIREIELEIDRDIGIDIMMIDIDIKEAILTREGDIEKQDQNLPMNAIIVGGLEIGLNKVIFLKKKNPILEEKMIEAIVPIPMIINQKNKNIPIKRKKLTSLHQI